MFSAPGFDRLPIQFVSYEILSLLVCIIIAALRFLFISYSLQFLFLTALLICFVLVNVAVSVALPERVDLIRVFLGIFLAHLVGGILARGLTINHENTMLGVISVALSFVLIGSSIYLILTGNIFYPQGVPVKPIFPGGIVSTELSNISGLALILTFVWSQLTTRVALARLLLLGSGSLCIWFMSAGTLLALLALVLFFYHGGTALRRIAAFLLLAMILIMPFWLMIAYEVLEVKWLTTYLDDSIFRRLKFYEDLMEIAVGNPITGIGIGNFYKPPHHNLLGLAAETGVLSAFLYSTYSVIGLVLSFSVCKRNQENYLTWALFLCASFIFMKGFVHDTWVVKSFYFAIGYVVNRR